jgi:hypothetical protein
VKASRHLQRILDAMVGGRSIWHNGREMQITGITADGKVAAKGARQGLVYSIDPRACRLSLHPDG